MWQGAAVMNEMNINGTIYHITSIVPKNMEFKEILLHAALMESLCHATLPTQSVPDHTKGAI